MLAHSLGAISREREVVSLSLIEIIFSSFSFSDCVLRWGRAYNEISLHIGLFQIPRKPGVLFWVYLKEWTTTHLPRRLDLKDWTKRFMSSITIGGPPFQYIILNFGLQDLIAIGSQSPMSYRNHVGSCRDAPSSEVVRGRHLLRGLSNAAVVGGSSTINLCPSKFMF